MRINIDELKKLEFSSAPAHRAIPANERFSAIIKVRQPHYVPPGVEVRARVDEFLFTGAFQGSLLADLETNDKVVSISLPKRLRLQ